MEQPETKNTELENVETETIENETTESNENVETIEEPSKEEFKPWKTDDKPYTIPYDRFREVNEERKKYREEYEKSLKELEAYRKKEQELEEIKDPTDINPDDFPDAKSYLKAYADSIKAQSIKQAKEQFQRIEVEKQNTTEIQRIENKYTQNLERASKINPEVREADQFLDKYVERIHPAVLKELLDDDYAPEIVYAITTNKESLRQLIEGNPIQTIKMLGKMSSYISTKAESKKNDEEVEISDEVKAQLTSTLPKPICSKSAPQKDIEHMTQKEYNAWANKNLRKR